MKYFKTHHKNLFFIFITTIACFILLTKIYIDKNHIEKMNYYKNIIQEHFKNNSFTMSKTIIEEKPQYAIVLEKNTITLYYNNNFNLNKNQAQIVMTAHYNENKFQWFCDKHHTMLPTVSC